MKTFAGLSLETPLIMGIVNTTPDSFSDGGEAFAVDDAVSLGLKLCEDGADIIDVGGESTRPGAVPVSEGEEIRRTIPVIEKLVQKGVLVSIDTRHAPVMSAALAAGAKIINDVSALTGQGALDVVSASKAHVVLMHMQGLPETMQDNPAYTNVALQVLQYLQKRVAVCRDAGIDLNKIAVDPGIGFGKTVQNNVDILQRLDVYADFDFPLLLGVSRKSFLGTIAQEPDAKNRLAGSIAAAMWAVEQGAHILRVHDVKETVQALKVWSFLKKSKD